MAKRLEGQVAWISGGASGIGEATARLFAAEGARVTIADMDRERGTFAIGRSNPGNGGDANFMECDVVREDDVRDSIAQTAARFGGLQIVVNSRESCTSNSCMRIPRPIGTN